MALTTHEFETFYAAALPGFLEYLRQHAQPVENVEVTSTTAGVTSLPALKEENGIRKTVLVPVSLLAADASAASQQASRAASQAAALIERATTVLQEATDAAAAARGGSDAAEAAVRAATETEDLLRAALDLVEGAVASANDAATSANEVAAHPTYIGEDNYVYQWDAAAEAYSRTNIYVRGADMTWATMNAAERDALAALVSTHLPARATLDDVDALVQAQAVADTTSIVDLNALGHYDGHIRTMMAEVTSSLANYYKKSETYSATEVDAMLSAMRQFRYVVADALPEATAETTHCIYLVPSANAKTRNVKDEYITITSEQDGATTYGWEQIGTTTVDLSDYPTTAQMNAAIASALSDYYTKDEAENMLLSKEAAAASYATLAQLSSHAADTKALTERVATLEGGDAKNHINYIVIDQTVAAPQTRVYGAVRGPVLQWIRANTHRVLGKYTATNTMTVCELLDTDTTKYHDGTDAVLDGTEGDVYVQLPTFWTKAELVMPDVWRIGFADHCVDETWHEWMTHDLIGAYEAYDTVTTNDGTGTLRSISGVASRGSVSQANFKAKARNTGDGFTICKWRHQNIMAMLYYAWYGNTDCQGTVGAGTSSYTKATGLTNALGMTDTVAGVNGDTSSINFWGLENWWGNKMEWVDNVVVDMPTWRITEDDGTERTVEGDTYTGSKYPMSYVIGDELDVIPAPGTASASSDTGYCDYCYLSSTVGRVVRRSGYQRYAYGGVGYSNANYDSLSTYASSGARLAFTGQIVKAESVAAYKAAEVYANPAE